MLQYIFNQWHHKFTNPNQPTTTTTNNNNPPAKKKEHYHSSSLHAKHRRKVQEIVQKERNTSTLQRHQHIKDSIRQPQDKDPQNNQTGIIYHYQCPKINCPSAYIGESGISLVKELRNISRPPPPSTFTAPPQDIQWIQNYST